ncbi:MULTISPECIES: alpha-ketoglutarate-dependent dioxygenase AlkB family protein [unclassified Prochlorococcus]|uniref:alpha-ketoglutarate-dependent dioxygenase AlkB family protein n=1 Tax=unclassified Prochlorococcus TaxID=2627481 RepID=UPI000533B61E|nr:MULTISPECIES: alpha-ketoglutarate-dependent dioxygenase AlkB [unclassified Prochlorococcus]KGG15117.1 Alkylated DNA repair protein [Prochlorococcus sp. MIT 0602]KGG17389.1 Alkylated DNA repair protein [Prochlorococcus sp. MIT 0603]
MSNIPLILIHSWISTKNSKKLINQLLDEIQWEQTKLRVFGKEYLSPRLTSFLGTKGITYSYSGTKHIGKGFPDWFTPLLKDVQNYCKTEFNGCLLNLYRDGQDYMGWHADNEYELDKSKPIASLSLGAKRDFFLKHKHSLEKHCIEIKNGDLLIMKVPCQEEWIHSIPKRMRVNQIRINLTFRKYRFTN